MVNNQVKMALQELFDLSGIKINGDRPYDIHIHRDDLYARILKGGISAVGESYMDGWWDCEALDQLVDKVMRVKYEDYIKKNWRLILHTLRSKIINLQKISRAYEVGEKHYDIGNSFYKAMLDKRMLYTSGYWKNADNLEAAQEAKLDLVCKKINLQHGMSVLDLGCGWGSFAKYAAEKYGASVTGVTVSKEQVELGRQMCAGLPVEIKLDDYRNVTGKYDRVISIGIMEHVGHKNYRTYMTMVERTLKDDGIAFIHTIGNNITTTTTNPWIHKYIFPNGMIPSIAQIGKAMEKLFVMEDWHNFGPDYDKTLMAWYDNFERAWPEFKDQYGKRFYRMWRFYLLSCAGMFRSRRIQLWQIVMTKPGVEQPECRFS
jgi:cyclopropane-fatty-acyl-phospholipid synthase